MLVPRFLVILTGAAGLLSAAPASAQFFLQPADLKGAPVTGEEPGMTGPALPGATPKEMRAALVWNLRAALNVAALQCEFEPTLFTRQNYNAILKDHAAELKESLGTLEGYFVRKEKTRKAATTEFDRFGTRVYSSFSSVSGQLTFCQAAASIGHDVLFAKRGHVVEVAIARMRELRASLAGWGEQFRPRYVLQLTSDRLPAFSDKKCWRRGTYQVRKCGALFQAPQTASRD